MISWTQHVISLERDSFKLFYFLEHLRSLSEIYVLSFDLFVQMNKMRYKKYVMWASCSIQIREGKITYPQPCYLDEGKYSVWK